MAVAIKLNRSHVPSSRFILFFIDSGLTNGQYTLARTLEHKAATYKEFFHISKLTDGCSWMENEIA